MVERKNKINIPYSLLAKKKIVYVDGIEEKEKKQYAVERI